tara:strand:- start:209 stop:364 length:156 start_codon:yes stop_codon:yes gene_type:complete
MFFTKNENGLAAIEYGIIAGFFTGIITTVYANTFFDLGIPVSKIIAALNGM